MNIEQLRYFGTVAQCESFAKAAEELFITRNGLTYQIKQMENELGSALFDRDSRHVELTPQGRALLPRARQILATWDQALGELAAAGGPARSELRVGMARLMDRPAVDAVDARFRAAMPNVEVAPTFMPPLDPASFLDDLAQGRLDAVFITEHEIGRFKSMHFIPLCPAYYGVLSAAGHRIAHVEHLTWSALDGEDVMLTAGLRRPENRWHVDDTLALFRQNCPRARLHFLAGDFEAMMYAVEHGGYVGIVSYTSDKDIDRARFSLRPVEGESNTLGIAVPEGTTDPVVQSYIDACVAVFGGNCS